MSATGVLSSRELVYNLRTNWRRNHRFHGGVVALARCGLGYRRLVQRVGQTEKACSNGTDFLTFSVAPPLAFAWSALAGPLAATMGGRCVIGDCCGGIHRGAFKQAGVDCYPLANVAHGDKLDLFIRHVCTGSKVYIGDDDVFLTDPNVIRTAQEILDGDTQVATVSFLPRQRFTWTIENKTYTPMGSYSLLINRETWLREGLSFRQVHAKSESADSYMGMYDTADYANVQLIRRGYKVHILPEETRAGLVTFKGVSSALIELQKRFGNVLPSVSDIVGIEETCALMTMLDPLYFSTEGRGSQPSGLYRNLLTWMREYSSNDRAKGNGNRVLLGDLQDRLTRLKDALEASEAPNSVRRVAN